MKSRIPASLLSLSILLLANAQCGATCLSNPTDPSTACSILKQRYSNQTLLPNDPGYTTENQVSWTASAWLGPACVFMPSSAQDLSFAVKTLVNTSTLFAMRGGGHMPISNAANINSSGVLISSTNLKTLALSEDKQTLSVGPGPRWGDVFECLDGTNLTIVGGRLAPVGVPGLLLGGGISYYSYEHGLGSSNGKIKAYEAVLADGTISTVTAESAHSDLYWALQGGGNSFALITRFDMQTFYAGTPLMAEAKYGTTEDVKSAYLDAVLAFTMSDDSKAAITPVARWGPNFTSPSYESTLFYNGSVAPTSGAFNTFVNGNGSLKALNGSSTLRSISLDQYSKLVRPAFKPGGQSYGLRQKFRVVSTAATREALETVHDIYFSTLQQRGIANTIPEFFTGLAFNAVTKRMAEQSGGMPQGIPPEPAFWIEESITWKNAEDDAAIQAWVDEANAKIEEKLGNGGYIYLNDADANQDVFASYGSENVRKLKGIRQKYDPKKTFTDLMPGGFKVEASTSG